MSKSKRISAKFTMATVAIALAALSTACSTAKKEADQALSTPSSESVTAARQLGSGNVTEVNFDKGSFVLTEGARSALRNLVNEAKAAGKVDDLQILAWSDVAYPSDSQQKASPADRDLAAKRGNAIRDFAKAELAITDVEVVNMAERPNAIQKMFDTSDARAKRAFENAGVTSPDGKSITGKASRAVVLVELER